MKLILGITTFDRLNYLKTTLESWEDTKNTSHDWTVVVADDGSPASTLEYLSSKNLNLRIIKNHRCGIHHQVNSILKFAKDLDFDYGFRIDDDLIFKKSGWDDAYIEAIITSGYDHLVFHDPKWMRVQRHRKPIINSTGILESRCYGNDTQGAFWTFTKHVISTVGYIDINNFNLCGMGHRDYTYRCCKAGFNHLREGVGMEAYDCIYDLKGSLEYLELNKKNYKSAACDLWEKWNTPKLTQKKCQHFCDNRIYIPYKKSTFNIEGKSTIMLL